MSLANFHAAVKKAANIYADRFGLTPAELEYALIANADLEGGLGEEAAPGDGGASVGRYQFNTAGGHGSTLIQQGYTKDQIAQDDFAVDHWAPILGAGIAAEKAAGKSGDAAIASAIFKAERPAEMYPSGRLTNAFANASKLSGQPTMGGTLGASQQDAGSGGGTVAGSGGGNAAKILTQLQGILAAEPQMDDPQFQDVGGDGSSAFNAQAYARAHTAWSQTFTAVDNLYKNLTGAEGAKDQGHAQMLADFQAKTQATHYQNSDAQTKAQSDIDTFFKGQDESRNRADLALKGQEDLIKWGTAPGKSSYSANDLGAAFANTFKQAGMDPSKGMLNYTGTTYLDPIGDMQRGDNLLGVNGKPPASANLLTGDVDPNIGSVRGAANGVTDAVGNAIGGMFHFGDSGTGDAGIGSGIGGKIGGMFHPSGPGSVAGSTNPTNLLTGAAGRIWDKAPALFKWG